MIALVPDDWVTYGPGIGSWAAWSLNGQPVGPGPIAVERIAGPIFAVGGGEDALAHSGSSVLDLEERLHGRLPRPTILNFEKAGHMVGLIVPNIPTETHAPSRYGPLDFGGSRIADERAREDAWPRMLAWLARLQ